MARNKVKTVQFRRRREGKTDYRKRLLLLKSGKSRLVVRLTGKNVKAQIIKFNPSGDTVLAAAQSRDLQKFGWSFSGNSIPAAYLVGALIGRVAQKNKVAEAILDNGMRSPKSGSKMYAVLKGAVDAGLIIPHSDDVMPSEDRLSGKHIAEYAKKLKDNKEAYKKEFSVYIKKNTLPEDIEGTFKKVKNAILKA
ncbi:MAG: 50S ribosomal protein L18 [Candidatus Nanoarchaeia archaeon]